MTIVVLGSSGQLASHLRQQLPAAIFWGRNTVDMADSQGLYDALLSEAPRAIINAAAYTAVDKAEQEPEAAWRLNVEAPAAAARAATAIGASLVHVSTDYVFDGRAGEAYREDAPVNPLNVYGASKLAGELAVRTLCARHWILRTSWVFSEFGANFVKTVLRLAAGTGPLRIVSDQWGCPTYAGDLAELIGAMASTTESPRLPYGTYHATGGPAVTWHAFAERIIEQADRQGILPHAPNVKAISTEEYPTPAARPRWSVLDPSAALHDRLGARFDWQAGLDKMLAALQAPLKARSS